MNQVDIARLREQQRQREELVREAKVKQKEKAKKAKRRAASWAPQFDGSHRGF